MSLFAPLTGLTQEQHEAGRMKQFTGDGTAFLKCPGLINVESVRIGSLEIPLSIEQRFRDNANDGEFVRANWPMIGVQKDATGTPILLRSLQSNDGIWQQGAVITVVGDWEEEKPAAKSGSKKPDSNSGNGAGNSGGGSGGGNGSTNGSGDGDQNT